MSAKSWLWVACAAWALGAWPILADDDLSKLKPGTTVTFDRGGERTGEFVAYVGASGRLMKVRVTEPNGTSRVITVPVDKVRLPDNAKSSARRGERPSAGRPPGMRAGPNARPPSVASRPGRGEAPGSPATNSPPADAGSGDNGLILGRWTPVSMKLNGRDLEAGASETAVFTRKACQWLGVTFAYELKWTTTPKEITLWLPSRSPAEFEYKGVYELSPEGLRLCLTNSLVDAPPRSFAPQPGDQCRLIEMKKEAVEAAAAATGEVTAFLDRIIALLTAEDYEKFLVLGYPPDDLARLSADQRQEQITYLKKSRTDVLKELRSMRQAEVQLSPDGTEATFNVSVPGTRGQPKLKKIDGEWHLL